MYSVSHSGKDEVHLYFSDISPVTPDFNYPLGWWKFKVSFAFFASNPVLNFIKAK
jgi:hypothetical protein